MSIGCGQRTQDRNIIHIEDTDRKSDLPAVTKEGNSTNLWHKCLGHMSEKGLKIFVGKNLFPGLKSYNLDLCEHCIYGRQRRVSFLRGGHERRKMCWN